VHGEKNADIAVRATGVLFGDNDFLDLGSEEIDILKQELVVVPCNEDLYQMIVDANLATSKSEARQFHASGAITVNDKKVLPDEPIDFRQGYNLIKRGKNTFALIEK
jgi:tyrosyl-tRNA synthetase